MIIALEEHYLDLEWSQYRGLPPDPARASTPIGERLGSLGELRIREMDESGIDLQVISHCPPGSQGLEGEAAVEWTKKTNDRLHTAVLEHPTRFAGLASVPTSDPAAGADELERAVTKLGFKGAIIHCLAEGPVLDQQRFWPIFERAVDLDVPVYLHPSEPNPAVVETYYKDYATTHPMFLRAAWGYTFETGTQAVRLVLSGLFNKYPKLQIILGHLGETIPFLLVRTDEALSRDTPMKNFREVFIRHFNVTTSGFFSDPALRCCIEEMGIDRVMFSVDWPFAPNGKATEWVRKVDLPAAEKEKLLSGNANRLLKL